MHLGLDLSLSFEFEFEFKGQKVKGQRGGLSK